jgi:hypothetical protein
MTARWEAGRKAPSDFHAAQKDTWPIYTWQIMTGERSGSYMTASPGHHRSDFDAREASQDRRAGHSQKPYSLPGKYDDDVLRLS